MAKPPRRLPVCDNRLAARAALPQGGAAHLPPTGEDVPAELAEDIGPGELVTPPDLLGATRRLFVGADSEDLSGDPLALDVLDELPAGHPERVGIVARLLWRDPEGTYRVVARDWTHELPTVDRVCRLVGAGLLPEGAFLVQLRRQRATAPPIRFSAVRPLTVAPDSGAPEPDLVNRLVDALANRQAQAPDHSELRAELARLSERIAAVERLAESVLPALQAGGRAPDLLESIASGLAGRFLSGAPAAAAPAAPGASAPRDWNR